VQRRDTRLIWRAGWALALLPLVLAACSSGSGANSSQAANNSLGSADGTVQSAMSGYLAGAQRCKTQANPVVCLEAADRKLGNQIHTYANLLAVGHGFAAPQPELSAARDAAQTLANSLEILGDAQPTQANYDQVLNTFNVDSAISQLRRDVDTFGR
jgi:hypothetical protein